MGALLLVATGSVLLAGAHYVWRPTQREQGVPGQEVWSAYDDEAPDHHDGGASGHHHDHDTDS